MFKPHILRGGKSISSTLTCRSCNSCFHDWNDAYVLSVQVGWSALRSVQTYMYACLQNRWTTFQQELDSCDIDISQCAKLLHVFAAQCCFECLIASDSQLSSVVAHLVVLCQNCANLASELLLGYPIVGSRNVPSTPSFECLCRKVMKTETWSQLQRMCADVQARVSFLTDCVAFKSDSANQLSSLHTDLSFNTWSHNVQCEDASRFVLDERYRQMLRSHFCNVDLMSFP